MPIDTAAVCSELQKTWSRPDAAQWASAYSAFQAGVIGLTKSLGKELARHDILVNCVTPLW